MGRHPALRNPKKGSANHFRSFVTSADTKREHLEDTLTTDDTLSQTFFGDAHWVPPEFRVPPKSLPVIIEETDIVAFPGILSGEEKISVSRRTAGQGLLSPGVDYPDHVGGFIEEKLFSGAAINMIQTTLPTPQPGNVVITLEREPTSIHKQVSADDTTPDFLFNKILGSATIERDLINDGGNEALQINLETPTPSLDFGGYEIAGTQVVGTQQAAIADPTGGATVDTELRAQLILLLGRLRNHGLIDT